MKEKAVAKSKADYVNGNRTLGPISDLERHLPRDWWRSLFTSLYLKTDGDVVENEANTRNEVDLLRKATGMEPEDRVLDLCCGQGRHSMELARRGFRQVAGLDRSRYLIRLAKKRAQKEGLNISYHEGDARKFSLPGDPFQYVIIMGNSFGYFEKEEDDKAVLERIKRALVSGGCLVMDLVDGEWMREHYERRSWEWIDSDQFVCRERSPASDGERMVSREVVVHAERGVIADQFYAERLYDREKIVSLLEGVGFINIRFYGDITPESDRGQDLGMMAHRMFLTATAPYKAKKVQRRGPRFPEVTVLMGDPSLPDSVKLGGRFNEEDFETIEKLKRGLSELGAYKFNYVDNHASLITELRRDPPAFVFNLCDEGYNNDAFLELHVPALLEMMRIPYTGAGPACLGLCYNKSLVRAMAADLEIPVPLETYYHPSDTAATLPSIFPALVKPNFGDSSVGITKDAVVEDPNKLVEYLGWLQEILPGRPMLIEEYLPGREFSVTIIGNVNQKYHVLPILEVDYSNLDPDLPRILGYESKWDPSSEYWTQINYKKAALEEELASKLVDYSSLLFERCGCRDYARFDFRTDSEGTIKLLEVNPNPGWCWDGKVNLMASFGGVTYTDLLRMILEAAQERVANHLPWQAPVRAEAPKSKN